MASTSEIGRRGRGPIPNFSNLRVAVPYGTVEPARRTGVDRRASLIVTTSRKRTIRYTGRFGIRDSDSRPAPGAVELNIRISQEVESIVHDNAL